MLKKFKEWQHQRRIAKWRQLCKRRYDLDRLIEQVEERVVLDPAPIDEFLLAGLRGGRERVQARIDQLEEQERRVQA